MLTANAALALGLVLYELATNATKYGALSVPHGRVDVAWRLGTLRRRHAALLFNWRESGGPQVSPPTRHGFGSELLQRQLRYELNGSATMDFREDGLQVMLEIPCGTLSLRGASRSASGLVRKPISHTRAQRRDATGTFSWRERFGLRTHKDDRNQCPKHLAS